MIALLLSVLSGCFFGACPANNGEPYCGNKPSAHPDSQGSGSGNLPGNLNDPIVAANYYWIDPNYECTDSDGQTISSYRDRLLVDAQGNVTQKGNLCLEKNEPVALSALTRSRYDSKVLGYQVGIYRNYDRTPDLSDSSLEYYETWCQNSNSEIEVFVNTRLDESERTAFLFFHARIDASVSKTSNVSEENYSSSDFLLSIEREPILGSQLHIGMLSADAIYSGSDLEVTCRILP